MEEPRRLALEGGRVLMYDDVGDPDGAPVVYLHGTPDSRLARHPDDNVAGGSGVRLLAIDRPGFGGTSASTHPGQLARDLEVLADVLDLGHVALLGWSSGGLAALRAAAGLGERCRRLVLVATLPPVEAYREAAVLDALGPARRGLAQMGLESDAAELAADAAPYLVPVPITPELAREHVLEGAGELGRAELDAVPGALDQLVAALVQGVAAGLDGVETDLREQFTPGLSLADITVPVHLVHGERDEISPPAVGEWVAAALADATVEVVPGAGHHLLFPRWDALMRLVGEPAG